MKNLLIILFIGILQIGFGQNLDRAYIDTYQNYVDSLFNKGVLTKRQYPNMSGCGGSLKGYYLDSHLVFIKSTYNAEAGYTSKNIYIENDNALKIIYHQHSAQWEKHHQEYPKESEIGNYENMTYTDTTYNLYLIENPVMFKYAKAKLINDDFDKSLYNVLIHCYKSMTYELNGNIEKSMIELQTEEELIKIVD
ncbi:MAG: hypothetical protein H6586_02155 [Flavobacteriales bacterium]|nr:hypothetical protein [Flavobacteriales bacterium]